MREIRMSGSMSGEGKQSGILAATALLLDSTVSKDTKSLLWYKHGVHAGLNQTRRLSVDRE
jgi:hypothetical protein